MGNLMVTETGDVWRWFVNTITDSLEVSTLDVKLFSQQYATYWVMHLADRYEQHEYVI